MRNAWAAARCIGVCNFSAIENDIDANSNDVNRRMVEYAKAVVDGGPISTSASSIRCPPAATVTGKTTQP